VVYDVLKADMSDKSKLELIKSFDEVLSLGLITEASDDGIDHELEKYVLEKIEERKAAKKEKNYAKADEIRNELLEKGILIKDTKDGVVWEKA
jgi:cysteinyl-tRNA synthetase